MFRFLRPRFFSTCDPIAAWRSKLLNELESKGSSRQTKSIKKSHLPTKFCVSCEKPFTWRKKWEETWDLRETCSKRCSGEKRKTSNPE